MKVAKGVSALNYRLQKIGRIAQTGAHPESGEIVKVKTESGEIWDVADLEPQGGIVQRLSQSDIDDCLSILRECSLSDGCTAAEALDGLALMGLLTQEQKRQVWEQLSSEERLQLKELREDYPNAA